MPPVVRSERSCIKVIGVTYINRPGAFFYPSPMGIIQCYLASYRAKSKASFFFQPSCKASKRHFMIL